MPCCMHPLAVLSITDGQPGDYKYEGDDDEDDDCEHACHKSHSEEFVGLLSVRTLGISLFAVKFIQYIIT